MSSSADSPIDEARVAAFESEWLAGRAPDLSESAPAPDEASRLPTLEELVQIDLEFRWKRAGDERGPLVEDYLRRFPELDTPAAVRRLVEQERIVRAKYGDRPARAEFRERFPEFTLDDRPVADATADGASFWPGHLAAGRYRVVREFARGGFGIVWIAEDRKLGREIALKQLAAHHGRDAAVRRRFVDEALLTAGLEHPGVVPIYDLSGLESDPCFYAMKLVRGKTLAEAIADVQATPQGTEQRAVGQRALLDAFLVVCQTMEFAHARGIVHRDLKPQNVVLSDFGETIVLDWGLAKSLVAGALAAGADQAPAASDAPADDAPADDAPADDALRTLPGTIQGTPSYMSPEQAAGEPVDARTDVYALGATLYQVLTGRPPFQGDSGESVVHDVLHAPLARPRAVDRSIDPPLEAICLRAMARDPGARYASAAALTRDVRRFLADERITAWREPLVARARRFARRRRGLVGSVAAAVLVGLAGLVVLAGVLAKSNRDLERSNQRERTASELANENFGLASGAVEQFYGRVSRDPRLRAVGLESLRSELLESAAEFYRQLADRHGDDPRMVRARAEALDNLSRITADIASPQDAVASAEQSISLYESLGDRRDADVSVALAEVRRALGDFLRRTGDRAGAEREFERALALLEPLAGATAELTRSRTLSDLGIVAEQTGRLDVAAERYGAARTALRSQVERFPQDPERRADLAGIECNLGILGSKVDRSDPEVEASLRRAVTLYEEIVESWPNEPRHRDRLAGAWQLLGSLLRTSGRFDEAAMAYGTALELQERLVASHPGVVSYVDKLAVTRNSLGLLHGDRGDHDASHHEYRAAIELRERLRELQPEVPMHGYALAGALMNLGNALRTTDATEARRLFLRGLAIGNELLAAHPDWNAVLADMGRLEFSLGRLEREHGDVAATAERFGNALGHYERLLARSPQLAGLRGEVLRLTDERAGMLEQLGRLEEAVDALERVRELSDAEQRVAVERRIEALRERIRGG